MKWPDVLGVVQLVFNKWISFLSSCKVLFERVHGKKAWSDFWSIAILSFQITLYLLQKIRENLTLQKDSLRTLFIPCTPSFLSNVFDAAAIVASLTLSLLQMPLTEFTLSNTRRLIFSRQWRTPKVWKG